MIRKNLIIDNLRITYYQSSTFEPNGARVFLHGWQSQAMHLRNILDQTANYIALDLPGFGQSELPHTPWSLSDYANFLKSFLDKLGIAEPTLIGHSVGGAIIVRYLAAGNLAKKIILIDASGIRIRTLKHRLCLLAAKTVKPFLALLPPSGRDRLRRIAYSAIDAIDYVEAGVLTDSYKKIIAEDLQNDLAKIKVPTALLWGNRDRSTPLWHGQLFNRLIAGSKLIVIDDAGHFPFIDQPQRFLAAYFKEINDN